ncbi:hypothetical protein CRG49_006035 [Neisseria sp. N95_16]|nr:MULTISPECIES: hypothetical protein [unclassified Neisseria]PJO09751.1 hypothetical protein CRG49_006035 [Neisseria sp. N95_16]PJO78686.1 hypothetical protein CWC45_04030 [Neisseria sp. N177_16]
MAESLISILNKKRLRPLQNPHFWRISSLCAARKLAYLCDMSALSVFAYFELHSNLEFYKGFRPSEKSETKVSFSNGLNV